MGVVEEDEAGSDYAGWQAVSRFPHDQVGDRDGQSTEERWQGSEGQVWHLVRDVGIANVLEVEVPIVTDQPAHEGEQQLAEGRVDVEEVCTLKVVGRELFRRCVSRIVVESMAIVSARTLPKWTSSNTTSAGWLIPQNRVTNARAVMMASAILYSHSFVEEGLLAFASLSSSSSTLTAAPFFFEEPATFLWRKPSVAMVGRFQNGCPVSR